MQQLDEQMEAVSYFGVLGAKECNQVNDVCLVFLGSNERLKHLLEERHCFLYFLELLFRFHAISDFVVSHL